MLGVGRGLPRPKNPRAQVACPPRPDLHLVCSFSHTVCSVVRLGPAQHAVPPLCFLLDLLEEVRGTEDPDPAGGGCSGHNSKDGWGAGRGGE